MTTRIRISGWNPGLKKISLNYLLRAEAGYSLSTAKRAVDDILDGKPIEFDIADDRASEFMEDAEQLGAIVSILPPAIDVPKTREKPPEPLRRLGQQPKLGFPLKFRHLLEVTEKDVDLPDEVWLSFAVCACESDACQWQGWIIKSAKRAGEKLSADTYQKCPECGRTLFRTGVSLRCAPTENQERDLVEGRAYEALPIEYDPDS